MRIILLCICLLPCIAHAAEPSKTARTVMEQFYRQYLTTHEGTPPFSQNFSTLMKQNKSLCAKHHANEICGFGSHGDPYLNAQDYGDNLTFENTEARISESPMGTVQVRLNVTPEVRPAEDSNMREITYYLVREEDAWVVDDIGWNGKPPSAKAGMRYEIQAILEESLAKDGVR